MTVRRPPLDDAKSFMDRVIYAKEYQKHALVLGYAASHAISHFNTFPRFLVKSLEMETGKTTVLDVGAMMCQNPWPADPTKWALQSKFMEPDTPTMFLDEVGTVFGPNGMRGRSNPLFKPLVEGYRRRAVMNVSVDRSVVDISSYCFAVMAGRGAATVPPDLLGRCIIINMVACPKTVHLEDSLDEGVEADGLRIGEQLHSWVRVQADLADEIKNVAKMHPMLQGRKLQIWGPLGAIALKAGGDWPRWFLEAFMAMALDQSERPVLSAEEQILWDAGEYLNASSTLPGKYLTSRELLGYVRTLDMKLYTAKSDEQMGRLMSAGLGRAGVLTLPDRKTVRGWHRAAILAAYDVLMAFVRPEEPEEKPDEFDDFFDELETTATTATTATTEASAA